MDRYTIGVLIGNANSPHARAIMRGVHDAAEKLNVNVMFFLGVHMSLYYRDYYGHEVDSSFDYQYNIIYDYVHLGDVDALIVSFGSLALFLEDTDIKKFMSCYENIPYVMLEDRSTIGRGTSIISDNYNGMYRMVEHLVTAHGYRKFTYLSGPEHITDAAERKQGFVDCLTAHGIPVTEDMFEYGDFSDCVEMQVNSLLDRYPDMEAMVCANDCMAGTAYQEINKRGYKIGKDIAITGYDDWELAESMTPPLSTVKQNEFDIGFYAVERAVDLCMGKEPVELIAPVALKIRSSCGCKTMYQYHFPEPLFNKADRNDAYINEVAKIMTDQILISNVNDEIREHILNQIKEVLKNTLSWYRTNKILRFDKKTLMRELNELIVGKYGTYVSSITLADVVSKYLRNAMQHEPDSKKADAISDILASIQSYIQSSAIKLYKDELSDFEQSSLCIPLISRDMMSQIKNEKNFYRAPMVVLSATNVKSSYLYIMDKPIVHNENEKWECPDKLYLASYHVGRDIVSYEPSKRPIVTKENGFGRAVKRDEAFNMCTYNLFLGNLQYGILVTEIDTSDMILMNLASLQISVALNFRDLYERQKSTQYEMKKLIEEINEKNKILGFISEYDELTGCLNRRGFMEKAMSLIHKNVGNEMVFMIADLDHLKEINDCFGHVEGDFAIKTAASILKEALGEDVLLARIGGDEFVTLLPSGAHYGGKSYARKIKEAVCGFNSDCKKSFYVELSVGFTEFIGDPNKDFNDLLKQSDVMMYEAKKTRRSSIKK